MMNPITITVTREDLQKHIKEIYKHMDTYMLEWHRKTRPIPERHKVIWIAQDLIQAHTETLKEMKKLDACLVIYRMDGNYKLIRKIFV